MAQLGTIKLQTDSGIVDVPVFDVGDSGGSTLEALRVQTDSGIGFVPLVDPADASNPQEAIRVQTDSGVKAVTDSASAIPDSLVQQNFSTEQSFSDGQIVDPFTDSIGSTDLSATDDPTFDTSTLNGGPGIVIDSASSAGDGYSYTVSRTEPLTIIWAFEVTGTVSQGMLYREAVTERLLYRNDNNEFQLIMNGNTGRGGSYSLGDKIVTLLVNDSTAELRVNGTQLISVASTSSLTIQNNGEFFFDGNNAGRTIPSNVGGVVVHNSRLSGSALTNEEQRLESEFGMNVL